MAEKTLEKAAIDVQLTQPIIVDLGKKSSKKIKALKEGGGELWDEVTEVLQEVKDSLGEEAKDKVLVPVILVYRRKPRRNALFPLLPPS